MGRNVTCQYETEDPSLATYSGLKRRYESLEKDHAELLELFDMLKHRPQRDAEAILSRLRTGSDIRSALSLIQEGDLLIQARIPTQLPTLAYCLALAPR